MLCVSVVCVIYFYLLLLLLCARARAREEAKTVRSRARACEIAFRNYLLEYHMSVMSIPTRLGHEYTLPLSTERVRARARTQHNCERARRPHAPDYTD